MNTNCKVEIKGHIIDSLTLTKIMDTILDLGAVCNVEEIKIGTEKNSISYARLNISADKQENLDAILAEIAKHGAIPLQKDNSLQDKPAEEIC